MIEAVLQTPDSAAPCPQGHHVPHVTGSTAGSVTTRQRQ